MLQYALVLDVIQVLDGWLRIIFNLAKVNTVPCMITATPFLVKRVDDWIV